MATGDIIGEEFHIFQNHFDERSIFCLKRQNKVTVIYIGNNRLSLFFLGIDWA